MDIHGRQGISRPHSPFEMQWSLDPTCHSQKDGKTDQDLGVQWVQVVASKRLLGVRGALGILGVLAHRFSSPLSFALLHVFTFKANLPSLGSRSQSWFNHGSVTNVWRTRIGVMTKMEGRKKMLHPSEKFHWVWLGLPHAWTIKTLDVWTTTFEPNHKLGFLGLRDHITNPLGLWYPIFCHSHCNNMGMSQNLGTLVNPKSLVNGCSSPQI